MSSRPAVRVVNDSMSESVDLLQMLITPPPPPPPPPPSTSRPAQAQPDHTTDDNITAAGHQSLQRAQMCYRACHACAVEQQQQQRYRQQLQSQQAAECVFCSCSQPRVDPRSSLCSADRDDTASIYFNPRGPLPPPGTAGARPWPRRPPPAKARGPGGGQSALPRQESNCAPLPSARCSAGHRRADEVVDDNDDCYDDTAGKRTMSTMSTSLSSRASSRTPPRTSAADICHRVRCYFRCWTRRCTNSNPATAVSTGDPQGAAATDFDLCIQPAHRGPSFTFPPLLSPNSIYCYFLTEVWRNLINQSINQVLFQTEKRP